MNNNDKEKKKALLMLAGSMLTFGTIGIFRRFVPLSSPMLAFTRGIIGSLFLYALGRLRKKEIRFSFTKKQWGNLILSGALIGFNWVFLFEAYNYTSIAISTLCYYMEPTIVILLSPLFFREKLTIRKIICALISIFGIALVSGVVTNGSVSSGDLIGMLFGLGAAVLYSSVVIISKFNASDRVYEKTMVQLLVASLALVPYILLTEGFHFVKLTPLALIFTVLLGALHTGYAYRLWFGAIKRLPSQTVAVFSYIDPISAVFLSAVFLSEPLTLNSVLGTVLVVGASYISERSPAA